MFTAITWTSALILSGAAVMFGEAAVLDEDMSKQGVNIAIKLSDIIPPPLVPRSRNGMAHVTAKRAP